VPEPLPPGDQRLRKSATSDDSGKFSFKDVPPGNYRLYAWQESFPLRIIEAEDLKPYDAYAASVRVDEGEHQQTDVRVVPLP
jgi:polysaccharide lyase family 4-like protein